MAIVRCLEPKGSQATGVHTETYATYAIVVDGAGDKHLQIDTYGSATRKLPGKKSQSIRLTPEAVEQLKQIISVHFGAG
jgi:hypothetical protein